MKKKSKSIAKKAYNLAKQNKKMINKQLKINKLMH